MTKWNLTNSKIMIWVGVIYGGYFNLAFAKTVKLEWEPIAKAKQYELQVYSAEKKTNQRVLNEKLDSPKWKGDLDPGVYVYRIRGIDIAKRPGEWSETLPLVVMPPSAELIEPKEGTKVKSYYKTQPLIFRWNEVQGIDEFAFELKKDGKIVESQVVKGTSTRLKELASGSYSWVVKAITRAGSRVAGDRLPASIRNKHWEGPASQEFSFDLESKSLLQPEIVGPQGATYPPKSRKLALQWKSVEGAQAYEVRLGSQKFTTSKTELIAHFPKDGHYEWAVRALASVDPELPQDAIGQESQAKFKLDKNVLFVEGAGYVAFSTLYAPYTYQLSSPRLGVRGDTDASSLTFRLSFEYFFKPQWGFGVAAEQAKLSLDGQDFDRSQYEVNLRYRVSLSQTRYGWSLSPRIGFEVRDYVLVTPSSTLPFGVTEGSSTFNTFGPAIGLDVRKQFNERWSLGVKSTYYFPVTINKAPGGGGTLSGTEQKTNFSLGVQSVYWLGGRWGAAAGAYFETRRVSYIPNQISQTISTSNVERIRMDGVFFFGSLIYRFGK